MWSGSVVVPMAVLSIIETHLLLTYLSRVHLVWLYFTLLTTLTVAQILLFDVMISFFSLGTTASVAVTLPTGAGDILRDTTMEYQLPRSTSRSRTTTSSAAVCAAIAV